MSSKEFSARKQQDSRLYIWRKDPTFFDNGFEVSEYLNESSLSLSQECYHPALKTSQETDRKEDELYDELLRELSLKTLTTSAEPAMQASRSSLQTGRDI